MTHLYTRMLIWSLQKQHSNYVPNPSEHNTHQSYFQRTENSFRDPHRGIPAKLMRISKDGQKQQSQNKQWKVNKAATPCDKHQETQVQSLHIWISCTLSGVDHLVYLAQNLRVDFNSGNSHLQNSYIWRGWDGRKTICRHCTFTRNYQMVNGSLMNIIITFSTHGSTVWCLALILSLCFLSSVSHNASHRP